MGTLGFQRQQKVNILKISKKKQSTLTGGRYKSQNLEIGPLVDGVTAGCNDKDHRSESSRSPEHRNITQKNPGFDCYV